MEKKKIWVMHCYHEVIEDYGFVEELGAYAMRVKKGSHSAPSIHGPVDPDINSYLVLGGSTSGPWVYWYYGYSVSDKIARLIAPKAGDFFSFREARDEFFRVQEIVWKSYLMDKARKEYWSNKRGKNNESKETNARTGNNDEAMEGGDSIT